MVGDKEVDPRVADHYLLSEFQRLQDTADRAVQTLELHRIRLDDEGWAFKQIARRIGGKVPMHAAGFHFDGLSLVSPAQSLLIETCLHE